MTKEYTDNRYFNQVREFHLAFGQPAPETPTRLTDERKTSRIKWMQEELDEYKDAETLYDEVDGLIDLIYFAIGTLVEHGVKPDPIFDVVNNANLSKLWSDGKPRFREGDNKIIKPDGWQPPETLIHEEI
ncbi:HAD family hydrolase [Mycobacterium sp. E3298]|nr:HAD family hydrolase [Mycobacterium sp. E3298]OBG93852.1 HAD family hydrolase [Mycobacterium sp. E3298]